VELPDVRSYQLQDLELDLNLGERGQTDLGMLLRLMPRLQRLHLTFYELTASEVAAIAGALSTLTALTSLTCSALASLWQPDVVLELRSCSAVRELRLGQQLASPQLFTALAASLRACSQLISFQLDYFRYPEQDWPAGVPLRPLFNAFAGCRQLKRAGWENEDLGVGEAVELCTALQQHPALHALRLTILGITDEEKSAVRQLVLCACFRSLE